MAEDKKQEQKEDQESQEKNKRISFEEAIDCMPQESQLALRLIMDALRLSVQILKSPYTVPKATVDFYKKHFSKQDTSDEIEPEVELASVIEQIEKNIITFVKEHPNPDKAELDKVLEASFKDVPKHLQPIVQMTTENVMNRLATEKKAKAVKAQEQDGQKPIKKENGQNENANLEKKENHIQKPELHKKDKQKEPKVNPLVAQQKSKKRSNSVIENKKEKKQIEEKLRKYRPIMREAFCQPLNQEKAHIRDKVKKRNALANANKVSHVKNRNRSQSLK